MNSSGPAAFVVLVFSPFALLILRRWRLFLAWLAMAVVIVLLPVPADVSLVFGLALNIAAATAVALLPARA